MCNRYAMKNLLPALLLCCVAQCAIAQQIPGNNTAPVKLQDVVRLHELHEEKISPPREAGSTNPVVVEEDGEYHFDRWLWYWNQHTDEHGNMVSPITTYNELNAFNRSRGKTTAIDSSDWKYSGMDTGGLTTTWSGNNGVGRLNTIAFHPTLPGTYWVGAASGGVWKTSDHGANWTCLTDDLPVISVSDIDVNPLNPNILYLCTGDRDGRDHYSIGVLKSYDGGASWQQTGLQWSPGLLRLTNSLVMNPQDTSSLTLAASDGIYKTYDAGQTWNNVFAGDYKQVLYHPTDTNILYATSFDTTNGKSAQIFRSANGGTSWTQVTNLSGAWRIELAVTKQAPNIVKAIAASKDPSKYKGMHGFYSSTDHGNSFTLTTDDSNCYKNILTNNIFSFNTCTGQGNYDLCITIHPSDPNKIYVGGVSTWMSENGGRQWRMINQWYGYRSNVPINHADKHFLGFHPLMPSRLYECNDGGLYWTDKPGAPGTWQNPTWVNLSKGLGITQFYRVGASSISTKVIGGTQDNGTNELMPDGTWKNLVGGDGMECHIDPVDSNVGYICIQRGEIYRRTTGGIIFSDISGNIPGQPTGGWITPYIISPVNNQHLLAGYKNLYWSTNRGNSWVKINSNAMPDKYIYRVAMSPASGTRIYASLEDSNVIYYTNSFSSPNPTSFVTMTPPYPNSKKISDIEVDDVNPDHIWVSYSGFNTVQVVEFQSGVWKQVNNGLPNIPVLCMERDRVNKIMYIGTDAGVYIKHDTSSKWIPYNHNLPNVHVTDLDIDYKNKTIWAATYGRGMWRSPMQDSILVTEDTAKSVQVIRDVANELSILPNPSNGQFTVVCSNRQHYGSQAYLRIIDNTGRTVWRGRNRVDQSGKMQVNVTHLPGGVYVIELMNGNIIAGRKRIVLE